MEEVTALITITAASGQLGRLVLDDLLRRGVRPGDIVATTRDVTRLQSYVDRGVMVRPATPVRDIVAAALAEATQRA
jgi:NAD(P)H dehydrogenase (quinone)